MLTSLCYAGANLVPICATPRAVRAFADRARRAGRRCSSIVGPAEATALLWRLLEPSWGPAREVRAHQPLMVTDRMSSRHRPGPVRPSHPQGRDGDDHAGVRGDVHRGGRRLPAGRRRRACSTRPGSPNSSAPAARSPASTPTARSSSRRRSAPRPTAPARSRACGSPPSTGGRGLAAPGMAAVLRYALARRGPGGEPLRERLQHGRATDVPQGGLPRGRRVHERPVLDAGLRRTDLDPPHEPRKLPLVTAPRHGRSSIGPLDLSAHVDEALAVQALAFGLGPDEVAVRRQIVLRHMTLPGRQRPRRHHRRPPRRLRLRHAQRPHPLVVHRRGAVPAGPALRRLARRLLRDHRAARPPAPPEPRHRPHPDHHDHRRRRRTPLDPLRDRQRTARPAASTAPSATRTSPARSCSRAPPSRTP